MAGKRVYCPACEQGEIEDARCCGQPSGGFNSYPECCGEPDVQYFSCGLCDATGFITEEHYFTLKLRGNFAYHKPIFEGEEPKPYSGIPFTNI